MASDGLLVRSSFLKREIKAKPSALRAPGECRVEGGLAQGPGAGPGPAGLLTGWREACSQLPPPRTAPVPRHGAPAEMTRTEELSSTLSLTLHPLPATAWRGASLSVCHCHASPLKRRLPRSPTQPRFIRCCFFCFFLFFFTTVAPVPRTGPTS